VVFLARMAWFISVSGRPRGQCRGQCTWGRSVLVCY
jgi:hypothetical protein